MNMRLSVAGVALAASLLAAGCASIDVARVASGASRPDVTVVNGQIVVNPEVLLFTRGQGATHIKWSLPRDSALRFPADGIVIEGELSSLGRGPTIEVKDPRQRNTPTSTPVDRSQKEIVDCKPSPDFKEFSCLNRNTRAGTYKYTIRVIDGSRTLERDPPIINMN
jgi:hypothetical protein